MSIECTQATRAEAYAIAVKADKEFQDQLVRQFGKANAGEYRYQSKRHDAATAAAREAFKAACEDVRGSAP